ncbi:MULTISPECIES: hypothetical protein [Streptomyces]|uniref:hypothetical protein n=1 Tax=Streptomyces TaxID=1883 RepID=UPI0013197B35|nr:MULTISPECIES: hypothetical protein [Streptomyces]QGZ51995.1 hypothetical protein GPZ77_29765 [Streptomyces sp. QHH-9511]GGT72396.1 hypothetical protein GCM10010272_14440 [Streptomyces lateritius]
MADNIMKSQQNDLSSLMERASKRDSTVPFEGYSRDDGNIPGNILIVESGDCVYSFAKSDIMDRETIGADRIRVYVREGATAFRLGRLRTGEPQAGFMVAMEDIAPPTSPRVPGEPRPASGLGGLGNAEAMEHTAPPPAVDMPGAPRYAAAGTGQAQAGQAQEAQPRVLAPPLSTVGSYWTNSCIAGDVFANNCAHFLSDAFIRAGYTELSSPNPHINARCYTNARRPIRARDMWSWFASKAVRTSYTPTPYTGWWAVFQLDENVYWGGHVALFDSDSWTYYGTGWHGTWRQYMYQW